MVRDIKCLIAIISLDQLDYTRQCIESILKITEYPYRILIVDNGSNKETIQYLKYLKEQNFAEVIFNSENLGWVKAVNQAMLYSDHGYVCIMNNDTVVYPRWLSEMVGTAQKDNRIGIVNPLWELPKRFKGTLDDYYSNVIKDQRGEFIETDWARGFCFLVKRAVIDKIGGLDEAFSPAYYDDWDYSMRAIMSGFRCVRAMGALVYHYRNITYSDILGGKELNNLLKEKGVVFYKRWGRPLKILLIIDDTMKIDLFSLEDFILHLLREQHTLFIIHNQKHFTIKHTNCTLQYVPHFIRIRCSLNIMNNLRHSTLKRYSVILSSYKVKSFLEKVIFVKNDYTLKEIKNGLENREEIIKVIGDLKKYT